MQIAETYFKINFIPNYSRDVQVYGDTLVCRFSGRGPSQFKQNLIYIKITATSLDSVSFATQSSYNRQNANSIRQEFGPVLVKLLLGFN